MKEWLFQNHWVVLFAVRFVLSVVVFAAGLIIAQKWWDKLGVKSLALYYGVRLSLLWVLIEIVGMVPPDISCWGAELISPILDGQYTAWSFKSVYYIGFVYLGVMCCRIFHSYFGLCFMFALAEFFAMLFLAGLLRRIYDEALAKKTVILYLASPFGLVVSFLGAQDEPLIMLAIFAYLYFTLARTSQIGRLLAIIFGVLFTKILVLFYMFPMVLQKRLKGVLALVGMFLLYFMARYVGSENILNVDGLSRVTTLGSFWYLLPMAPQWLQFSSFVAMAFVLSCCLAPNFIMCSIAPRQRLRASIVLLVCLEISLVLTHRMVFSAYLLPMIPLLIALFLAEHDALLIAGEKIIAVIWLFVMVFADSLLYGMGCLGRHWILNAASVFCILLNIIFMFMMIKWNIGLFYNPVKAFNCVVHYLARWRGMREDEC